LASPSSAIVLYLALFILVFVSAVHASGHHGLHHSHLHHRDDTGADGVVKQALEQIRAANKYRLEHPWFHNFEFSNGDTTNKSQLAICDKYSANMTYSSSAEVLAAAKQLAEAHVQNPVEESLRTKTQQMKEIYWGRSNDINEPEKASPAFNGLLKRDASVFWMEEMAMNGVSPYTPSGYQVSLFSNISLRIDFVPKECCRFFVVSKTMVPKGMGSQTILRPSTELSRTVDAAVQTVAPALCSLPWSIFPRAHTL
jgi:hypothetical protein